MYQKNQIQEFLGYRDTQRKLDIVPETAPNTTIFSFLPTSPLLISVGIKVLTENSYYPRSLPESGAHY
jgi:hypothetical protein